MATFQAPPVAFAPGAAPALDLSLDDIIKSRKKPASKAPAKARYATLTALDRPVLLATASAAFLRALSRLQATKTVLKGLLVKGQAQRQVEPRCDSTIE